MQFSVIIPAHNAEKTLRRAVESVLAAMEFVESDAVIASHRQEEDENPKPLFEILIVENGSEDATEFIARSLQADWRKPPERRSSFWMPTTSLRNGQARCSGIHCTLRGRI